MIIFTYEKNEGPESSRGLRVVHMSPSLDECHSKMDDDTRHRWAAKPDDPWWSHKSSFTGPVESRVVYLCAADGWYWAVFEHTFVDER